jgi:hypothetical protein
MENPPVTGDEVGTNAHTTRMKLAKPRRTHGLSRLIKSRSQAVISKLDGRSGAMIAMNAYKADLLASLGGADLLSQQELTIVDMVTRDAFILEQIDAFILQRGLINKRKRTLFPIAVQRQAITDGIIRKLLALGLTRLARPIATLQSLLSASPEGKETPA